MSLNDFTDFKILQKLSDNRNEILSLERDFHDFRDLNHKLYKAKLYRHIKNYSKI